MGKTEKKEKKAPGGSKNLFYGEADAAQFPRIRDEILLLADLRPTDHVLDVGCAEGWHTLEMAKVVAHAHGFDPSQVRIDEARRLAAERGIGNATFEVASVIQYRLEPLSVDVTLFSAVWGSKGVGLDELELLLKGTRRELIARIRLVRDDGRLKGQEQVPYIHDVCERNGFDVLMFPTKYVIAVRRGADVRLPELPPVALLPTRELRDHPIVRRAAALAEAPPLDE